MTYIAPEHVWKTVTGKALMAYLVWYNSPEQKAKRSQV